VVVSGEVRRREGEGVIRFPPNPPLLGSLIVSSYPQVVKFAAIIHVYEDKKLMTEMEDLRVKAVV
jgi:hypothetical protein